mgnify:CR=1 FL=1
MSIRRGNPALRGSRQSGTTLMEVLVSLLVLSFGMLGMAGVQGVSLRGNQAAYYRTMATTFSGDIVERMRANMTGVDSGGYDDVAGAATASCFTAAGCSSAQMAAQDVLDWTAGVAAAFPLGGSSISYNLSTALTRLQARRL